MTDEIQEIIACSLPFNLDEAIFWMDCSDNCDSPCTKHVPISYNQYLQRFNDITNFNKELLGDYEG